MSTILIIESNSPDLLAKGVCASAMFARAFMALDPRVTVKAACPYAGPVPEAIYEGVDGVVFTGAAVSWSTDAPEAAPIRDEMERSFAKGRPVWGSCNGMQLAAVVLGGGVGASPNGFEIGLARQVRPTESGRDHPMMSGRSESYTVPCVHRDEVQALPEGAVLIAGNAHSPVQAMAYEINGVDFWGAQYHPEMTMADIARATGGAGMFTATETTVADYAIADTDEAAARRLGTSVQEMGNSVRMRELANWLAHVSTRA